MKILYFDCFAGISGDMTLAALADCGADINYIVENLKLLPMQGWRLHFEQKVSQGIRGTALKVHLGGEQQPHRHYQEIKDMLIHSGLPDMVKSTSITIFNSLAVAEARVHGTSVERVHFHEVGAVDSIIDIVGAALALHSLDINEIHCSELPVGNGTIRCSHGLLPVPAPATAELLKDVPLRHTDIQGELVTPTGAAIIKALSKSFGQMPSMLLEATGYGFGTKNFGIPNFLRVFKGESREISFVSESVCLVETNIDDMNPEIYEYLSEKLFEAGALDVYITPIIMKKSRPGSLLTIICRPHQHRQMAEIILSETTTLGVRYRIEERYAAARYLRKIQTKYGVVHIKVGQAVGNIGFQPEYEDCKKIARSSGRPLKEIYNEVLKEAMNILEDN